MIKNLNLIKFINIDCIVKNIIIYEFFFKKKVFFFISILFYIFYFYLDFDKNIFYIYSRIFRNLNKNFIFNKKFLFKNRYIYLKGRIERFFYKINIILRDDFLINLNF